MKKTAFVVLLLSLTGFLHAQNTENLASGNLNVSWYLGPTLKITQIKGDVGMLPGIRGGFIINESLLLGGVGYSLSEELNGHIYAPTTAQTIRGVPLFVAMNYGGLEIGYLRHPQKLLHYNFTAVLGLGHCYYQGDEYKTVYHDDRFLIVEPHLRAELNITPWFRINIGAAYRFMSGVDLPGLDDEQLRGSSATFSLLFGRM